jgi:hypothetical protein
MLINAGRAADVVRLYDGPGISLISRRQLPSLPARWFTDGPTVAAALRAVGRNGEAEQILAYLDREIDAVIRRNGGKVPRSFLAYAAQTWALEGKADRALSTLERVGPEGWAGHMDFDDSSLNDFGDEPAFKSLRGQPRFEALRRRINDLMNNERREAMAQLSH